MAEYGGRPISYGAKTCAFAAVAESTSPADIAHPLNSFIAPSLLLECRDIPSVVRPCPARQSRRRFRRSLGRIAARLPQIGGGAAAHAAGQGLAMRPATLARLYDRKKFGKVGV